MRAYVEPIWGWDEAEQERLVGASFHPGNFSIITCGVVLAGSLSVLRRSHELFLEHLMLLPDFQRRGLGTSIIRLLIGEAAQARLPLRLSVLRGNPARELYLRLGFRVERRDERTWMELPPL
jgi:ribosomal protein S18 acetylase RimI-like enzyme